MTQQLQRQLQEQRAAKTNAVRLRLLLEELAAQEPFLEYTKQCWGRGKQQAGLELKYAQVLARMYPGSLHEEAEELEGFYEGALGEWQKEHSGLSEHHRQVLQTLEKGQHQLYQLHEECLKRSGAIADLRKQKEYQQQRYKISAQLSW